MLSCPATVAAVTSVCAPSSDKAWSSAATPRFTPDCSAASILTSNQDSIECDTNCTDTRKMTRPGKMPIAANSIIRRAIRREPNLPDL